MTLWGDHVTTEELTEMVKDVIKNSTPKAVRPQSIGSFVMDSDKKTFLELELRKRKQDLERHASASALYDKVRGTHPDWVVLDEASEYDEPPRSPTERKVDMIDEDLYKLAGRVVALERQNEWLKGEVEALKKERLADEQRYKSFTEKVMAELENLREQVSRLNPNYGRF